MLDKIKKAELIQRTLGLRHKLKVAESVKKPETHEDISLMLLSQWELEDELRAIEELLEKDRLDNRTRYKDQMLNQGVIKGKHQVGKILPSMSAQTQNKPQSH